LHEFLADRLIEQLLDHQPRDLQAFGQVEQRLAGFEVHEFEQQIHQAAGRNAGLGQVGRNRRRGAEGLGELIGRQHTHCDEVIAEPAAFRLLTLQRRFDLDRAHQPAANQDIAEASVHRIPANFD